MAKDKGNVLTEDFLFELYYGCFQYDYVCGLVCTYMDNSYLPGRDFQSLQTYLRKYYKEHKSAPTTTVFTPFDCNLYIWTSEIFFPNVATTAI
jgi:hypothetical protein